MQDSGCGFDPKEVRVSLRRSLTCRHASDVPPGLRGSTVQTTYDTARPCWEGEL